MISPIDVAELMLRHLPQEIVRPLVGEYMARLRRAAAELLDDVPPPPGFASWADHPSFNREVAEVEWTDCESQARKHMAQRNA